MSTTLTIRDVADSMGINLTSRQAWHVGAAVRERHLADFDRLPVKELRPKASGTGTHCLAVYPASYQQVIRDAIKTVVAAMPVAAE